MKSGIRLMVLLTGAIGLLASAPERAGAAPQPGQLTALRCEGVVAPLAVEEAHPRLTWIYDPNSTLPRDTVQVAARVVVAKSAAADAAGKGDVWDSGWVKTGEFALTYAGPALAPGTDYWWSVITRNNNAAPMAWSAPARLRTAGNKWTASWIQAPWSTERDGAELDGSRPMPIFRREFTLTQKPVEAILRIAGLGQYDALIDGGTLITPEGLHQAWTDYRKTVTYDTYDLTADLKTGANVLGVMLGNGMYNVQRTKGRYTKFVGSFGPPRMIAELRLRYADGSSEVIGTDAQWKVTRGPIVFSSTYGGEDYDARRVETGWDNPGFQTSDWSPAMVTEGPGGRMTPAIAPDVRHVETHPPVKVTVLSPTTSVYDLGQNFAGWPRIKVIGPPGAVLRLTPGELLQPDGSVTQQSSGHPQWWTYTLRGGGAEETWSPRFSYYGFRYLQAEWVRSAQSDSKESNKSASAPIAMGKIVAVEGDALSSDSPVTGSFASSSEMLNAIHSLIVNAMHNNEVSLFTDCPHREKLGWLEETHLVAPALMFNGDLQGLYAATEHNIADAQLVDGEVPTTAPQYTIFGTVAKYSAFDDSPEWGSASVLAPWSAYRSYGDLGELRRSYPTMKAYVTFLESKAQDGIVAYGLGDWYDIGPGAPGIEKNTTLGVTGTLMLYEDAVAMQKIAALLGNTTDAKSYAALAQREKNAFNKRFWNTRTHDYDRGSQTANAMPLALGIVPQAERATVLAHIVADIHAHKDHVTTGEVGYPYLLRALMQSGRNGLLLAMMLRKDPPSYGSQLAAGATSLTEAWDANPHSSQDHFMLGDGDEWFYRGLGGIDFDMSRTQPIIIHPAILDGIDWVRCGYASELGKIESDWRRANGVTTMDIVIPAGVTALVYVPAKPGAAITEGGIPAAKAAGMVFLRRDSTSALYRVGSGSYHFRIAN